MVRFEKICKLSKLRSSGADASYQVSPDTVRVERSVLALQLLTPLLGAVLLLRALHNAHLLPFPC